MAQLFLGRVPALMVAVITALLVLGVMNDCRAAEAGARRKVIIDQDAYGPAGSNMQAILLLLQSKDVEVLGITIPSGDGWRDEEVSHTLRLLEIAQRTEIPVFPGAVFPLVNTQERTKRWEALYGPLFYKGAWTETWPDEGAVRRTPYHGDETGPRHVAQRSEVSGAEDHLAVRRTTRLLEGRDLLVKTLPVSGEHVSAGDDDVDLMV